MLARRCNWGSIGATWKRFLGPFLEGQRGNVFGAKSCAETFPRRPDRTKCWHVGATRFQSGRRGNVSRAAFWGYDVETFEIRATWKRLETLPRRPDQAQRWHVVPDSVPIRVTWKRLWWKYIPAGSATLGRPFGPPSLKPTACPGRQRCRWGR